MKKLLSALFITLLAVITGCSPNLSPNTYNAAEVGVVSKVKKGVVVSRREVKIDNESGVGGLAGAAAGATGGAAAGNNVATSIVAGVGGAVIGGVVGSAVDKGIHKQRGFEYIIKLEDGNTVSIVQNIDIKFDVSQHVLIIYGALTRLVPDEIG